MNLLPLYIAIASPTPTAAVSGTTGTLATATYFYKVVARMLFGPGGPIPGITNSTGELHNVAGAEVSQAVTLGQLLTLTIPWTGGVTHYDVYRSTTTGTEVYLTTVPAVQTVQTNTLFVDNGTIAIGTTTAASVTASSVLPGNCFVAGGNAGGLNTQIPVLAPPVQSPFIEGRNAVIINPTGGSITINFSPDGVTAMAAYVVLTAAGTVGAQVDISTLGKNLLTGGLGGLPKFLVASAAGAYLLGSP